MSTETETRRKTEDESSDDSSASETEESRPRTVSNSSAKPGLKLSLGKLDSSGGDAPKRPSFSLGLNLAATKKTPENGETNPMTPRSSTSSRRSSPSRDRESWKYIEEKALKQNKTPEQIKAMKLAYFEKICTEILEYLYLGNDYIARNKEELTNRGVTHVINAAGTICPAHHPTTFTYKVFHFFDGKNQMILPYLWETIEFVETARKQTGKVYVHCEKGVSRSNAIVISYLMWKDSLNYDACESYVKDRRATCSPNTGFIAQLYLWYRLLTQRTTRLWRVGVFPRDPSQPSLVNADIKPDPIIRDDLNMEFLPLMVESLDPRTCFVLHVQNETAPDNGTLYVWKGSKSQVMSELAQEALQLCQRLQTFHKAPPSKVIEINQGEEPASFWTHFTNGTADKRPSVAEHKAIYPDLDLLPQSK